MGSIEADELVRVVSRRLNEVLSRRDQRPADMARLTGLGNGVIYPLVNGTAPGVSLRTLTRIADAYKVPLDYILGRIDLPAVEVGAPGPADRLIAAVSHPAVRGFDGTPSKRALVAAAYDYALKHPDEFPPEELRKLDQWRDAPEIEPNGERDTTASGRRLGGHQAD